MAIVDVVPGVVAGRLYYSQTKRGCLTANLNIVDNHGVIERRGEVLASDLEMVIGETTGSRKAISYAAVMLEISRMSGFTVLLQVHPGRQGECLKVGDGARND